MAKGFVTIAENSIIDGEVVDYLRLAYGLALSIKATQTEVTNISVLTSNDTVVPDKYKEVFDEVIRIPWSTLESGPKFHNEPMVGFLSPYEETIKIEADMLLVKDLWPVWNEYLRFKLLWFTSNVYTYRNEKIFWSPDYREDFLSNKLPNVYNGLMYFRMGEFSTEFFKVSTYIFKYWKETSEQLLDYTRPRDASTDVVYAMATKMLDISDIVIDDFDFGFVHMKNGLQRWDRKYGYNNWYDNVQCFISDDLEIKVGHYKQLLPFHYHHKSFLTDAIIKKYERHLGI